MAAISKQQLDSPQQTLFHFERQMIPWARTTFSVVSRISLMIFAAVFLFVISYVYYVWRYMDEPDAQQSFSFLTSAVFLSLTVAPMLLDFAVLVAASANIGSDKVFYRWDLMRLALEPKEIVQAKYQALRLRPSRMLAFNITMRAVLVLLIFVWLAWGGLYEPPGPTYLDVRTAISEEPTLYLTILASIIVLFSLYIVEPLWRSRAMVALGLWISGYVQEILVGVAITTLAWASYWIGLFTFLGVSSAAFLGVGALLGENGAGVLTEENASFAIFAIAYVLFFVLLNWIYPLAIRRLALWQLTKRVAQSDY